MTIDFNNPHVLACEVSHGAEEHGAQNEDLGYTQSDLTHALAITFSHIPEQQLDECLKEISDELDVEISRRLQPILEKRAAS